MAMTWFCPLCWHHQESPLSKCPSCGRSLEQYNALTYEEKLVQSLYHPIREQRMIAIGILGRVRYLPAIPEFARIVQEEEDPFIICEVIRALRMIGTSECIQIIATLREHPSVIVRNEACV